MGSRLRILLFGLFMAFTVGVSASDTSDTLYPCGAVNYGQSAQALYNMTVTIIIYMYYVNGVLYAIASLLSLYSATNIYLKLHQVRDDPRVLHPFPHRIHHRHARLLRHPFLSRRRCWLWPRAIRHRLLRPFNVVKNAFSAFHSINT